MLFKRLLSFLFSSVEQHNIYQPEINTLDQNNPPKEDSDSEYKNVV